MLYIETMTKVSENHDNQLKNPFSQKDSMEGQLEKYAFNRFEDEELEVVEKSRYPSSRAPIIFTDSDYVEEEIDSDYAEEAIVTIKMLKEYTAEGDLSKNH